MDTKRCLGITLMLILTGTFLQAKSKVDPNDRNKAPTITITNLDVNDTKLKFSYQIRNESGQDIWFLTGLGKTGAFSKAFMAEDYKTLLLRRWFGVPRHIHGNALYGRYVRLPDGQSQTESVSLYFPKLLDPGLACDEPKQQDVASRLSI